MPDQTFRTDPGMQLFEVMIFERSLSQMSSSDQNYTKAASDFIVNFKNYLKFIQDKQDENYFQEHSIQIKKLQKKIPTINLEKIDRNVLKDLQHAIAEINDIIAKIPDNATSFTFEETSSSSPLDLYDGDLVTGIEELSNGGYRVNGTNNVGEHRYIDIDKDGNVTGFAGTTLGYVGDKFKNNLESISEHFNVAIPIQVQKMQWFSDDNTVEINSIVMFANASNSPHGSYRINATDNTGKYKYINIDLNTGKITGHNGDNLDAAEQKIKDTIPKMFALLKIPPIILFNLDLQEGNKITSIVRLKDGSFRVNGENDQNEHRYIDISLDGTIKGHHGHGQNLGYVEQRMKEKLPQIAEEISKKFKVQIASSNLEPNRRRSGSAFNL